MLFERQRLLLTLLNSVGAPVLHAAFQNLLFLYTRECEATPSYDFVPAGSGAFSFTACADKEKLIEKGLLAEDDENWALTKAGGAVARREAVEQPRVAKFLRKYSRPRGQALILEESRLEREALARVAAAKPTRQPAGLLTIGYEGRSLESYLNELLRAGGTLLCDVRGNPFSRKYGFSKSTLSKACEAVGIRYEHLPELGIASDARKDLKTQEEYEALFARYEKNDLPRQGAALSKALTCYEAQPGQCHRHCVAEALERIGGAKLRAHHL